MLENHVTYVTADRRNCELFSRDMVVMKGIRTVHTIEIDIVRGLREGQRDGY